MIGSGISTPLCASARAFRTCNRKDGVSYRNERACPDSQDRPSPRRRSPPPQEPANASGMASSAASGRDEVRVPVSGNVQFHRRDPAEHPLPAPQKATLGKSAHPAIVVELRVLMLSAWRLSMIQMLRARRIIGCTDRANNRLVARRRAIEEELKKYEEAGSDVRGLVDRCSAIVGISTLGRILRGQRSGVGRMLSDNPIMILRLLGSGGGMLRLEV